MKKILSSPLFVFGLLLRIAFIFVFSPLPVLEWYAPFIQNSISPLGLDPWGSWVNKGEDLAAFPYGYVMWICFLPFSFIANAFDFSMSYGYSFTILGIDLLLLMILRSMTRGADKLLLLSYWLSPIVITASYIFGLNDLVPVFFLTLSITLLKKHQFSLSGFVLMAAISAKLSMILAFPFFIIYLVHNRALSQFSFKFITGLLYGGSLFLLPFLFSSSGMTMLFSNPEMTKVYRLTVGLVDGVQLYLVPLIYSLTLYATWRVRRINFELFQAMMGISFLLVVLLSPASPGWFIWAIPLLILYQINSDRIGFALVTIFSLLYMAGSILANFSYILSPIAEFNLNAAEFKTLLFADLQIASFLYTAMIAVGIVLFVRIMRETIVQNDYFRLSRKPFVIGIAGDSGAGKDTYSNLIRGLFGAHSVTTLSGDDYHLWDRHKPMWQVMTHLNPMANDLESYANDLVALADGKSIQMRHYDHKTGRMGHLSTIKANDFIIASGLHALYLPILRDCYALSVYLDIDENLRRYFKIQRDVGERGHTLERVLASFEQRETDSERFIRPQVEYADLVFSVQSIHSLQLEKSSKPSVLRYKLLVRSRHGLNELSLIRVLVGVCGLHVDMSTTRDVTETELVIEGDASAQDVALAAQILCPRVIEFLDINPGWEGGVLGLMQLITLSHINQALIKRFI